MPDDTANDNEPLQSNVREHVNGCMRTEHLPSALMP